ncbi:uncharacterized protein LOC115689169 [Syzygium oleosum]|uniref:uncharacterized protein LOC115689169 n=1 Tax=Syzygium oleosum TaxID=219896 RepID=UPI0024BB6E51|nr:uncharacterized protein LOC115689169 [Syzygium oleosum]
MACWSSENATKAYLRALKMGKRGKEPDSAEFISALAAGNNARLMVMVPSPHGAVEDASMTLALVAAAHQTGGRVVHVSPGLDESRASRDALGPHARRVEFLVGKPRTLLLDELRGADFVLLDCRGDDPRGVFEAAREGGEGDGGGIIVGYNALHKGTLWRGLRAHFLPIGEGLMLTRIVKDANIGGGSGCRKKSRWVVTVDDCTGEEHVFRIVSPQRKVIEA